MNDIKRRIVRAGVFFDCKECGELLFKCESHNPKKTGACPDCAGDLKKVALGTAMTGYAIWYRCLACRALFMQRRDELVPAKARPGFNEFT